MHLRGKYPLKQNKEIKEIMEEKLNSFLNEEEFVDIVSYMYNKEDSEMIIKKLKSLKENKNSFITDDREIDIGFEEFQKVFNFLKETFYIFFRLF